MAFDLFDILQKRAELSPKRPAMQQLETGESVDYGQMHRRAGRTAALLRSLGVEAGDRVAVLCRNRIEFFEILVACARLSAILVPLNWRMPANELQLLMEDCGARVLLHGAEDRATARELHYLLEDRAKDLHSLDLDDESSEGFRARRDTMDRYAGRERWPADDTWYLLYTSGTTGQPKAVIQTYGMALANSINIGQAMGLRRSDTTLCFLPLFHTGGINLTTLPALFMGAEVLVTGGFDPERTLDLIEHGRLDTFFAVPAVYQALALCPRFETLDFSSVRCWACGGAPMPDALFQAWRDKGVTVLNGMGMTETGPTVFLMDEENAHRKIGSVGKPQLLSRVRVVGRDGQDVPQGESGELWFSGPGITPGYYNRPEATNEALVDGTWLRSGDLGRQDNEGYFHIVGRLKDMYISGGENVYPAEVENKLAEHPAVLEAAVIGIPDEKWGETGCAFIEFRPGHEPPPPVELHAFLRERLAAYKVPSRFVEVTDFPRTAAGKVQKHLLNPEEG